MSKLRIWFKRREIEVHTSKPSIKRVKFREIFASSTFHCFTPSPRPPWVTSHVSLGRTNQRVGKNLRTKLQVSFVVEIIWRFDSRANKFPQSVNKYEWSLLDLDSSDSSARDRLGKVICFSVFLDFLSILEALVIECVSDALELGICSYVLLGGCFYTGSCFYRKRKGRPWKRFEGLKIKVYTFCR